MTATEISPAQVAPSRERVQSLDIVRGIVMVLMAIDHVRLYGGVPTGPDAAHFLTRWITHFCAPCFVFFAGTSAFLNGRSLEHPRALAPYLVKRGLLLVLLELTVIRLGWTFNLDFKSFTLAGVIWMLGWCMVLLAPLVRFSAKTVGVFGVAVMLLQSAMHPLANALPNAQALWNLLFLGGPVTLAGSGYTLQVLYTIIPWVGIMAGGYGFGAILTREPEARDRACLRLGMAMTVGWLVIGSAVALKSGSEGDTPFWITLLNQNKYRDSQLFLLMTLGPAIAFLPLANRLRGSFARVMSTFGKAPLLYYVLHIWLIHIAALVTFTITNHGYQTAWFASAPFANVPRDVQWSLGTVYLVWAVCVTLLYWPCRWLVQAKQRQRRPWMRYL